jgi:hypothetical protein
MVQECWIWLTTITRRIRKNKNEQNFVLSCQYDRVSNIDNEIHSLYDEQKFQTYVWEKDYEDLAQSFQKA